MYTGAAAVVNKSLEIDVKIFFKLYGLENMLYIKIYIIYAINENYLYTQITKFDIIKYISE